MKMDEFSILLEEHRAMRVCAARLLGAVTRCVDHAQLGALLHPLAWMASRVHGPNEDATLLRRLGREDRAGSVMGQLMAERVDVAGHLVRLSTAWEQHLGTPRPIQSRLVDVVQRLDGLMTVEERVLYPAVYGQCTDDDLWHIGVVLDRNVDRQGRGARAAFIQAHQAA